MSSEQAPYAVQRNPTDPTRLKRALTYLRVSTGRQLDTAIDIDPDGLSIHTQRKFAEHKVESLDAYTVMEFIEPGNSAKNVEDRPVFRELLNYLMEHRDIDYVVVYMRSRAFRNHFDAAIVGRQLEKIGVRLVSAKEDFGEGPNAVAMEGMLDIMNGWVNTIQGLDIQAKMYEKAKAGGTLGATKVGYLNVVADFEGRQINTVAIDPLRAPLVRKGFELYATGDYTLDRLELTMADLGLTAPARGKHRERIVSGKWWHRLLKDPYYVGEITYRGETFKGRHEPIVSYELFQRVQDVRQQRSGSGKRDRIHHHYLKGILFCDRCAREERTSRLIYTPVKGRGGTYEYYLCRGRQEGFCDLPHLPVSEVEEAIVRHYGTLRLSDDFVDEVLTSLEAGLNAEQANVHAMHMQLTKRLKELDSKEERLIDLAADGSVPQDKIRSRLRQIQADRERASSGLVDTTSELKLGRDTLLDAVERLRHPDRLYAAADDPARRFINETFFSAFYIDQDGIHTSELADPFDNLVESLRTYQATRTPDTKKGSRPAKALDGNAVSNSVADSGSSTDTLVELRGLEPLTPTLPVWCATSCAIAPYCVVHLRFPARRTLQEAALVHQIGWSVPVLLQQRRQPVTLHSDLLAVVHDGRRPGAADVLHHLAAGAGVLRGLDGVLAIADGSDDVGGQLDALGLGTVGEDRRDLSVGLVALALLGLVGVHRGVRAHPCLLLLVVRQRGLGDRQQAARGAVGVVTRRAVAVQEREHEELHLQLAVVDGLGDLLAVLALHVAAGGAVRVLEEGQLRGSVGLAEHEGRGRLVDGGLRLVGGRPLLLTQQQDAADDDHDDHEDGDAAQHVGHGVGLLRGNVLRVLTLAHADHNSGRP